MKCRCAMCEPDRSKTKWPASDPNDAQYAPRIGGAASRYPHVVNPALTRELSADGVFHDNAALVAANRWENK
jgi:hypothetical protein